MFWRPPGAFYAIERDPSLSSQSLHLHINIYIYINFFFFVRFKKQIKNNLYKIIQWALVWSEMNESASSMEYSVFGDPTFLRYFHINVISTPPPLFRFKCYTDAKLNRSPFNGPSPPLESAKVPSVTAPSINSAIARPEVGPAARLITHCDPFVP